MRAKSLFALLTLIVAGAFMPGCLLSRTIFGQVFPSEVNVSWQTASFNGTVYLERRLHPQGAWQTLTFQARYAGEPASYTLRDLDVDGGATYSYRAREMVLNAWGQLVPRYSNVLTFTLPPRVNVLTAVPLGPTTVQLSWTPFPGIAASQYQIVRKGSNEPGWYGLSPQLPSYPFGYIPGTATTYVDGAANDPNTTVESGTTYRYKLIVMSNVLGSAAVSNDVTVTTP